MARLCPSSVPAGRLCGDGWFLLGGVLVFWRGCGIFRGVSMSPAYAGPASIADALAPILDRGGLPERIQVMRDVPRHNLRCGDVFSWSDVRRAFVCDRIPDLCVIAGAVRQRFFDEFNHAGPAPARQMELATT
jgi:hypothetical protein